MEEKIQFHKNDIFFMPVLCYFVSWISYCLIHSKNPNPNISGRLRGVVLPQLEFENAENILNKLIAKQDVNDIEFILNMDDPGDFEGKKIKTDWLNEYWLQQMVGHSYETSLSIIERKYSNKVERKNKWPSELQFFYHLRNGCYHGNNFDIRNDNISTVFPPIWRGKEIKYTDNNQKVLFSFVGQADCITLLHDIQKLIV